MKRLQIYIIISSSVSSSIKLIFCWYYWYVLIYGITLSAKVDNWQFSSCLLALQRLPLFQRKNTVILRSIIWKGQTIILKRFCNIFIGQLKSGLKYPFIYSFPGRGFHITIFSKLMDTFSKHWSDNSVILTLNGLFHLTSDAWIYFVHPPWMIKLSIFISFISFLTLSIIWHS